MRAGTERDGDVGIGKFENDRVVCAGEARSWQRAGCYRSHLARSGDWLDRCLAAIPVGKRGPLTICVVPPNRRDEIVLDEFDATARDVSVKIAVAVVETLQTEFAGVLPE